MTVEWPDVPPDAIRVNCTIPGEPLSKQRPRFGRGRAYDPAENSRAQANICLFIRHAHKSLIPDDVNTFSVRLLFYLKTGQRRDLDNMCKLVMDACTGLVWKDDYQVMELFARQQKFSDNPRTEIVMYTLGPLKRLSAICEGCGKEYTTYRAWQKTNRRFCGKECRLKAVYPATYVKCCRCGKEIRHEKRYVEKNKTGRFWCSEQCKTKETVLDLTCAQCGRLFHRARSLVRDADRKRCCSVACRALFQTGKSRVGWSK